MTTSFIERSPRNITLYGIYVVLVSWASMYVFAVHTSHYVFGGGILLFLLAYPVSTLTFSIQDTKIRSLLASRSFWIICLCLLAALEFHRYAAHSHDPHPSTAAPALILPAAELAHGRDPYTIRLLDGSPISPGPGWILLLAPLTLAGGVTLLTPIGIGVCAYLISRRSKFGAGLFVILLLLQPDLVAISFAGHDIFVIPLCFAALCMLAESWKDNLYRIAFLAVVSAAFATSRIPMVALLIILGIGLFRLRRKAGMIFLGIALPLTMLIHAIFFLWARHDRVFYQPLHLFTRAANNAGHGLELTGLAAATMVFAWVLLRMDERAEQWIAAAGLFLVAAFVPVGLGELLSLHQNYSMWEGSNYVSFGASLLVVAIVLSSKEAGTAAKYK